MKTEQKPNSHQVNEVFHLAEQLLLQNPCVYLTLKSVSHPIHLGSGEGYFAPR